MSMGTSTAVGWEELQKLAREGNSHAIDELITTIETIGDKSRGEAIDLENAEWYIADVTSERQRLEKRAQKLEEALIGARWDLRKFKESVTELLFEELEMGHIEREWAKEFAVNLGVKPPTKTFTVTVNVEIVVTGVEADDEDDAEEKVRNGITVDADAPGEDIGSDWNVIDTTVAEE